MPSAAFDLTSTTSPASSGAVGGSAFVPGIDRDMGPSRAPRLSHRPAFLYFAHPERWQIVDGRVLPLLGKLKLRAGVMGVLAGKTKGSVNLRLARVACEERGRTVIPVDSVPDAHVPAGQPKSYLRTVDAANGPVVLSLYEQAFPGTSETRCDAARWVEFLQHQIDSGLVEPAPTWVLERMRDQRQKSLERMESNGSTNVAKRTRLGEELEVLRQAIAARMDNAQPVAGKAAALNLEG